MPTSQRPRPARRGSVPVAPWQRQRLGHTDRLRIMDAARRLNRATYRRGSGLHGGFLRDSGLGTLWHLLFRGWGRAGACDPAIKQIALETMRSIGAVCAALARLEQAQILTRVRRGVVRGGRFVQATTAYLFRPGSLWASDSNLRAPLDSLLKERAWEEAEWPAPPPISEAERLALARKWGLMA